MTAIVIPSRRLRQPTSDGRIRTDGLGLGIGGVFNAIGGRINLKGVLPTSNSGTRRPGIHGMGVSYSSQSTIFPNGTIPALAGNPITIGFLFSLRTLSQYSGLFSYQPGTTLGGIEVRLGLGVSDSDLWWRLGNMSTGYNYFSVGAGTFAANTADNRLVLSSSGKIEDPVTVILNGRLLTATKTGTATGNLDYSTGNICYGSRTEGTTFLDGVIYQSPFWNRRLSIAEAMEWCAYPWSIYQSASRRIYFDIGAGALTVSPSGIASAQALGTARLDLGLSMSAIGSVEAFGSHQVNLDTGQTISGAGAIATAGAFGAGRLDHAIEIEGIGSPDAYGTPRLDLQIVAPGILTGEAFGSHQVNLDSGQSIFAGNIASAEGFGTAQLLQTGVIAAVGIGSAEAFGTARLDLRLALSGLASAEAIGTHQVNLDTSQTVSAAGAISTAEAFGTGRLDFGLLLSGVASAEAFGAALVQGGVQLLAAPYTERSVIVTEEIRAVTAWNNGGSNEA